MSDPQFRHLPKATLLVVDPEQRFWPARVRWRLRGAWMWPSFVAITLLDGIVLHALPPVRTGIDLIPAVLLATFGNLVLIGAVGPWLARRVWRRRPAAEPDAPPKAQLEVLSDRMGTGLLVASVFAVLAAGLAARPTVIAETDAKEEAAQAIHAHIQESGDAELIRNEETAHAARLADGLFRICIARDDRERFACFIVDTNKDPTGIVRDPSAKPNEVDP
ncbi:MAG: hypothetical protein ACRDM7_09630 [Thermoleophilaceae bacterium]